LQTFIRRLSTKQILWKGIFPSKRYFGSQLPNTLELLSNISSFLPSIIFLSLAYIATVSHLHLLPSNMPLVNTSITIAAPPTLVREVFLDFANYEPWSKAFLLKIEITKSEKAAADLAEGDALKVTTPGMPFEPTVLVRCPVEGRIIAKAELTLSRSTHPRSSNGAAACPYCSRGSINSSFCQRMETRARRCESYLHV
jgi:hypothetical protein